MPLSESGNSGASRERTSAANAASSSAELDQEKASGLPVHLADRLSPRLSKAQSRHAAAGRGGTADGAVPLSQQRSLVAHMSDMLTSRMSKLQSRDSGALHPRLSALQSGDSALVSKNSASGIKNPALQSPGSADGYAGGLVSKKTLTRALKIGGSGNPSRSSSAPDKSAKADDARIHNTLKDASVSTVVREAKPDVFSAPSCRLSPYGIWFTDNLVMLTNAIRFEVKDMFQMLLSMHERVSTTLKHGDIKSFLLWLVTFRDFFATVTSWLQLVFLRLVDELQELPPERSRAHFEARAADLQYTVTKLLKHRDELFQAPPPKVLRSVRKILEEWSVSLLTHLAELEEVSATIIKDRYSLEECLLLDKQMVKDFEKQPNFKVNLCIMLRWLGDRPETASAWRTMNLDKRSLLSYPRWVKKLQTTHLDTVTYFTKQTSIITGRDA